MENQNRSKVVIILLTVIIILLVLCILFATGTISFNKKVDNNPDKNTSISIKVDDSKDYVYDAEYKYNNKYTEYVDGDIRENTIEKFGISIPYGSGKLSDLKVPYINLDSSDAKSVNKKLESLYLEYAKAFDENIDDKEDGIICHQILNYKFYKYNDILSVIVFDGSKCTTPFAFNYATYNFDLNNGKLLSYDDVLTRLNLNKATVTDSLKKNAKAKMDSLNNNEEDLSKACNLGDSDGKKETSNCYDMTYQLLQKSIDDNNILYFVDNSGELNVMMILYMDFIENGDQDRYLIKATTK